MSRDTFSITLRDAHVIAPYVRHLSFTRDDGKPFVFIPGQFITIHFTAHDRPLHRSYSLANSPDNTPTLEFSAGYFPNGPATELLFGLNIGDSLTASGPFGRLILRDEDKPKRLIMVATSTGVTPFRSMMPSFSTRMKEDKTEIILLLGVRNREDLIYKAEFLHFAERHPLFQFRACFSRDSLEDRQFYEYRGYVQSLFHGLSLSKDHDVVYLCGNPGMIDEAFDELQKLGFTSQQIRREKYISPKK
jgi:ferredoxin-NADP reductase